MANVHIPDELIQNILARLPGKPLSRFKSVSKHWNNLITAPYFAKLISRRMIILSFKPLLAIASARSVVNFDCPYGNLLGTNIAIVGTFDGIILLLLKYFSARDTFEHRHKLVLYNPFTGESKILPEPPSPYKYCIYTYGFGYGATSDDLKIVRFKSYANGFRSWDNCDVFDFKKSRSWENIQGLNIRHVNFRRDDVGRFLNGFLYWIVNVSNDMVIIALDVKEMEITEIYIPDECIYNWTPLGTMNGCLCILNRINDVGFDVWMMKEQGVENSWCKAYSFALRLEGDSVSRLFPISIMDSGNIVLTDYSCQLIVYDVSKGSHTKLAVNISNLHNFTNMHGVEYVHSLVSVSDLVLDF